MAAADAERPAATAGEHARDMLKRCGQGARTLAWQDVALDPDLAWARSGAMALSGEASGPPLLAPGPFAQRMAGALLALSALSAPTIARRLRAIDAPALLGERAAIAGLARSGRVSPGGGCRLLRGCDGWLALNLARAEDVELLPAWLEAERPAHESAWEFATGCVARAEVEPLVARGRSIGLALAAAAPPRAEPPDWLQSRALCARRARADAARPLVLDLSSLWAGPLCGHLLERAGARVIKLESSRRPDGARSGPRAFFDLLNSDKQSVALDLRDPADLRRLCALIERVDVVIESARPRALEQLGIRAEACVAARPGLSWIAITGHGRSEPEGGWVAFGDDAGVAAGLSARMGVAGGDPLFCADAIADPLTGVHAAVAAMASFRSGGGELIELSLRDVTEHVLARGWPARARATRRTKADPASSWRIRIGSESHEVAAARARPPCGRARALGADNESVLRELAASP